MKVKSSFFGRVKHNTNPGQCLWAVVFLVAIGIQHPVRAQNPKPNIVVFVSDDQSQIDVGCYGNKDVMTPNMDKLASQGMKYNAAYAASPMCNPSRTSMLTGLYPFRNGSQMNHFATIPGTKTLPDYMEKLGYRVVLAGKVDVFPAPNCEHIGEYFGRYSPPENRNDPKKVTVNFIRDEFKDDMEKPICLIISTWWPHVPWVKNQDFDTEKIKVPDYMVDTKETREALGAYYQSIRLADTMLGEVMDALDNTGQEENTVFMWFSDQGTQFPGAKWTTYDQGLRIPFVVRWPGKVDAGSESDALISLVDLTPTLLDLAGGTADENLDGRSFVPTFLEKSPSHREYIFAETSVEPHYWYNYNPARTVISQDGYQLIKNFKPGVRFITHIDGAERNMYYFGSWIEAAQQDPDAQFLLNRYSYRPYMELYNLDDDFWELKNLAGNPAYSTIEKQLAETLDAELNRQGETTESILKGPLPQLEYNSYELDQGLSVSDLSFNKKKWRPDTLFVTAFVDGLDREGVFFEYFHQFHAYFKNQKIVVEFSGGKSFESQPLTKTSGHVILKLRNDGAFEARLDGVLILSGKVEGDYTKINTGYVSSGLRREEKVPEGSANQFEGKIMNLRVGYNSLLNHPNR